MDERWKNLILDHYKNPRFFGEPTGEALSSEQHNRTCGDHVTIYAKIEGDHAHWSFTGAGCSLCLASASLMMELIQDREKKEIEAAAAEFDAMWEKGVNPEAGPTWQALDGLRQYPVRSRCVKLAWQGLAAILPLMK